MICVIEDNIRFCYREFNVQDYTPIKWIEGVSRIPDIPYVGDKDLARLDYDGKGNSRRIMELYGDYNTAARTCMMILSNGLTKTVPYTHI